MIYLSELRIQHRGHWTEDWDWDLALQQELMDCDSLHCTGHNADLGYYQK